jgi:hypothetical protein
MLYFKFGAKVRRKLIASVTKRYALFTCNLFASIFITAIKISNLNIFSVFAMKNLNIEP